MKGIATLQVGSALGSSIFGVLLALNSMRKTGAKDILRVNIKGASAPARFFFQNYYANPSLIEVVDLPISVKNILGKYQPATDSFDGEELFFSRHLGGYHETDFDFISSISQEFWEPIRRPHCAEVSDVCMHVRRGDKLIFEAHHKVHGLDEYASYVEHHLPSHAKICIVTDDYNTFLDFKKLKPGWQVVTTSSPENAGFNIEEINKAPEEVVRDEVDRMLTDYEYIRQSGFFIGTVSSNVSRLALLLRGGKNSFLLS